MRSEMHGSPNLAAVPTVLPLVRPDGVVSWSPTACSDENLTERKGRLPTLGWNSWNAFSCDIDATKVMTAANQVVSLGLKDAGYEYINSETSLERQL
jgi:hypothetical protein